MRILVKVRSPEYLDKVAAEIEMRGGRVISTGKVLPIILADMPRNTITDVASMPEVEALDLDEETAVQLSLPSPETASIIGSMDAALHVGAQHMWEIGVTGHGAIVAVLDTGVCQVHPALAGKIIDRVILNDGNPCVTGHGTHVAGAIAASHTYTGEYEVIGVAPDARIIDIHVLDERGKARTGDIIRGFDEALARGAKLINISLGLSYMCCTGSLPSLLRDISSRAVVVAAAGNSGPRYFTVSCPACLPQVIAVGSISVKTPRPDTPAYFSSRGPGCFDLKPDIAAPGGAGDRHGEKQPIETIMGPYGTSYAALRGTSMAAPYVTGILALAWELYGEPPTEWNAQTLVTVASRPVMDYPNVTVGHGVIDASRIPGRPPHPTQILSRIAPIIAIGGVAYALSNIGGGTRRATTHRG